MVTDYKEKYNQALERARALYAKGAPDSLHLEEIFPELKESEGERIRKDLIETIHLAYECGVSLTKEQHDKYIVWLEKQVDKTQGKSAMEAAKEEKVDNQNCVEPAKTEQKNKWKPTDDQINELQRLVTSIPYFTGFRIVVGLLIDLKKLKED